MYLPSNTLLSDALTDAQEAHRLDRQNVCSWSFERNAWTTAVAPGVWNVIPYEVELRNGDTYERAHRLFAPGVPGWYDLKVYLECELTPGAAWASMVNRIRKGYQKFTRGTGSTIWVPLVGESAQLMSATTYTALYRVYLSGASGIELGEEDGIQFGWCLDAMAGIGFIERFYARFVAEKITDKYSRQYCCEGEEE